MPNEVSVIEAKRSGFLTWSSRRLRLRFLEPCPYDLFKAAIDGFMHEANQSDNIAERFHSRFWQ